MLPCSRALEIPILGELAQSDPLVGGNPSFLLALVVLFERLRGGESKWRSYLDILPLSYSIPLFFSYGELSMLKECEHTWVGVKKMVVNAAMQYVYVEKMLGGLEARGGKVSVFFLLDYYDDDDYFVLFCFVLFCFVFVSFYFLLFFFFPFLFFSTHLTPPPPPPLGFYPPL